MKKGFKISVILLIIACIEITGILSVKHHQKSNDAFREQTNYITAENLAVSDGGKAADGDANTVYRSFGKKDKYVTVDLGSEKEFNTVILKEDGLNIKSFSILISNDDKEYKLIYEGDKVEYHRLCTFDTVTARYVRVYVYKADASFSLKEIEIYNQPRVNSNNFRRAAYFVNSDFYNILNDENIPAQNKYSETGNMLNKYNFKDITHVFFYCSATFDETGKVFLGSSDSDQEKQMQELEFMVKCMRDFGNVDLKISFVIGFSADPAKNTAMQEKDVLISNIISFANEFGFDGVDFDYEFPITSEDYSIFSEFLVALKDKMKTDMHNKEESTISCAFGTMGAEYPAETVQAIDMVNMMTYDIFDQDGEHSSFWSCAVQGAEYLESVGFSKEQINIGIPFYGTQTDALMEQYIYKDLENTDYYSNYYSVQTYLKDGSQTEVYFNGPAIVRDKTAYALIAGYGGIMVWHGACDTDFDSPNSLWRAVDTAVEQFGGAE